jgi:hypothetical protein
LKQHFQFWIKGINSNILQKRVIVFVHFIIFLHQIVSNWNFICPHENNEGTEDHLSANFVYFINSNFDILTGVNYLEISMKRNVSSNLDSDHIVIDGQMHEYTPWQKTLYLHRGDPIKIRSSVEKLYHINNCHVMLFSTQNVKCHTLLFFRYSFAVYCIILNFQNVLWKYAW